MSSLTGNTPVEVKPWLEAILDCIIDMNKAEFSTTDLYNYQTYMSRMYPNNENVREKMRQQLIFLRRTNIIDSIDGRGRYRLIAKELLHDFDFEPGKFLVTATAIPNAPAKELRERTQRTITGTPKNKTILSRRRDARIGEAGESVILLRERETLRREGRDDLASLTEQVSKTKGDYIGYDILSFDKFGKEKWIEVKTTTGIQSTKFFISENQVSVSELNPSNYWLYRLYQFNLTDHKAFLYTLNGDMRKLLNLEPAEYKARPL